METNKPHDYEECSECGYDHSYETEAAYEWHKQFSEPKEDD